MAPDSVLSELDLKRVFEEQAAKAGRIEPDFGPLRQRLERSKPSGLTRTLTLVVILGSASVACSTAFVLLERLWVAQRIENGEVVATLMPVEEVPFSPSALSVYLKPEQHHLAQNLGVDLRTPDRVGEYTRQPNWAWGITVQSSLRQGEAEQAGIPALMQDALFDNLALERLNRLAQATRFLAVSFQSSSGAAIRVEIVPSTVYQDPFVASLVGEEASLGVRRALWYDQVEASYPPNDGSKTTDELKPTARRIQQLWVRLNDSTLVFSPEQATDDGKRNTLAFARSYLSSR